MAFAPAVIAAVGVAASIAGTAVSYAGAQQSADAQKANANYQAQVAANNQTIANQNAAYSSQAGAAATTAAQLRQRAATGEVAADLAANGLDINTGTPSAIRSSQAELTQLDTGTTAQNAALNVYGYKTQSTNFGAQQGLLQQEASQAGAAGGIAATSTLLSGAGGLASKWTAWQNVAGNPGYANNGLGALY